MEKCLILGLGQEKYKTRASWMPESKEELREKKKKLEKKPHNDGGTSKGHRLKSNTD